MVTHRWPGAQSAGTFARLLQQGVVAMLDGVVLSRKRMVYKNGTQSVNNWFSQFLVWNWGETLLNFVFSMWIRMIMHWVSRGVCGDGGWPEKTGFECVYQRKCGSKASGGFLGIGQNISKPSDSMNVAWTLKAPFFFDANTRVPRVWVQSDFHTKGLSLLFALKWQTLAYSYSTAPFFIWRISNR